MAVTEFFLRVEDETGFVLLESGDKLVLYRIGDFGTGIPTSIEPVGLLGVLTALDGLDGIVMSSTALSGVVNAIGELEGVPVESAELPGEANEPVTQ